MKTGFANKTIRKDIPSDLFTGLKEPDAKILPGRRRLAHCIRHLTESIMVGGKNHLYTMSLMSGVYVSGERIFSEISGSKVPLSSSKLRLTAFSRLFGKLENKLSASSSAPMPVFVEQITHGRTESFRLLKWQRTVAEVEVIRPENRRETISGVGDVWHMHADAEITFVQDGAGVCLVGDHIERFSGPALYLIAPYVPHCWEASGDCSGYAVQLAVDKSQPLTAIPEWNALSELWAQACYGVRFSSETEHIIEPILSQMVDADRFERVALLFQLFTSLLRTSGHAATCLSTKPYARTSMSPHVSSIQAAITLILQQFTEELELGEMLKHVGMSKATFSREFKRYTGRSFTAFINEVRVDAVCHRLTTSDDNISAIAFDCGFANLSHFNRVFRELKGSSPQQYRKNQL